MRIYLLIFTILSLFFRITPVFAGPVINELMPHPSPGNDWIEIYNPTTASIDLSNWTLVDNTSIMKTLSGTLSANGFITFDVSNRLNNSGDSVYLKDSIGNEIDSYSYSSDPGVNQSIGRSPDGNNWTILTTNSKGAANGESAPTPTPTPTPSAAPSPTLKPTSTPTPKKTATPSPSPASTPAPLPTETSEDFAAKVTLASKRDYRIASVSGATSSAAPSASPSSSPLIKSQKQANPLIWLGTISLLLGGAGVGYIYLRTNGKLHFPFRK